MKQKKQKHKHISLKMTFGSEADFHSGFQNIRRQQFFFFFSEVHGHELPTVQSHYVHVRTTETFVYIIILRHSMSLETS